MGKQHKPAQGQQPAFADVQTSARATLAKVQPYKAVGSLSAADDVEVLEALLRSWEAYQAGDRKACIEHFAASVQHDSPLHIHPRQDPPFYSFLLAALAAADSAGIPPAAAAVAAAFLCVSDPQGLGLSQQQAGERLDALAAQHRELWWVQYAAATFNVLRGNHRQAAEALTRAILAGGPCGMYYNRARVYSNLEKAQPAGRDYHKFLELAPPDHRSMPDAYYALALDACSAHDDAAARQLFRQGQAAEAQAAPWVPYSESQVKYTVEMLLRFSGH